MAKGRATVSVWAHFAGALACLVPVALMVSMSYYRALGDQQVRARTIAMEVLQHEQSVSEQIGHVRVTLTGMNMVDPCGSAGIELMRNLALSSSRLQAVGYIRNNRLICSSYGNHGAGIPVGLPDYLSARGAWIRRAVELPIGTGQKFLVVTDARTGFSSIGLADSMLDLKHRNGDAAFGIVGGSARAVIAGQADLQTSLLPDYGSEQAKDGWVDANHVGAIVHSPIYDYAGVALIPMATVYKAWLSAGASLVPIGLLLGIALWLLTYVWFGRHMSLLASFKRALVRDELYLTYMPVVDLVSGRPVGAEALLRWRRRAGEKMVGPDSFIPLAEENHLIGRVTEKMLGIFAEDARRYLTGHADVYVSLNLSGSDFSDPTIVKKLLRTRAASGIPYLMVEATEGVFLNIEEARDTISQFRNLGVRVAIDDFGTGYSNLSYLGSLDVDCLKIDRSFVSAIGTGSVTSHVADHIIAIAKQLGLTIVAEGVETQEQADHLKARGVRYAQGWLFGKPMAPEAFAAMLRGAAAAPQDAAVAMVA